MEFITDSIEFEADQGPLRTADKDITFGSNVTDPTVVLTGAKFGFSHNDDHHLGMVDIKVDVVPINGNTVRVTATLGVRDKGNYDDDYEGTVYFAVLADL